MLYKSIQVAREGTGSSLLPLAQRFNKGYLKLPRELTPVNGQTVLEQPFYPSLYIPGDRQGLT